jgi:hypothetical protein
MTNEKIGLILTGTCLLLALHVTAMVVLAFICGALFFASMKDES